MSIERRLLASLRLDAVNGTAEARGVLAAQAGEAIKEITNLRAELAAMTARAKKAEAELADLKSPGKIASQLRAVRGVLGVPDTSSRPLHLYVADVIARAERLAAYVRANIEVCCAAWGDAPNAEVIDKQAEMKRARAAVDAAGDLEVHP